MLQSFRFGTSRSGARPAAPMQANSPSFVRSPSLAVDSETFWRRPAQTRLNTATGRSRKSFSRPPEANTDRMRYDLCRPAPASWNAPASKSSAADSSGPDATGQRPEPIPCSPSNAASKTGAGPTSSIGELAALQPLDQKHESYPTVHQGAWRGWLDTARAGRPYEDISSLYCAAGGWHRETLHALTKPIRRSHGTSCRHKS